MTIAEVSKKYQISSDTLRYYERMGLIPPVPRTAGGIRNYDQNACNWVEFIKCMRSAGISVDALAEYVTLFYQGDESIPARKALLMEQREQLAQRISNLTAALSRLDHKLDGYEERLLHCEKKLY